MWRLGQAVQSMLTMMLTWRTDQTLAGAISNGLHDGVAKRRRLGHESAVTTYYVQYLTTYHSMHMFSNARATL